MRAWIFQDRKQKQKLGDRCVTIAPGGCGPLSPRCPGLPAEERGMIRRFRCHVGDGELLERGAQGIFRRAIEPRVLDHHDQTQVGSRSDPPRPPARA
jgi:hypothetical protein